MRPPRVQRSPVEYPLDAILGSVAHVRLMRVLLNDVGGSVSVTDAARIAGLSTAGARKALNELAGMGAVARVGSGRAQKFGPAEDGVYAALLSQLFEEEQRQYEDLLASLRHAVAMPEVISAWLREPADFAARALELDITVEPKALGWIGPEVRARLAQAEKRFDVIIEVNAFTRADGPELPGDATLLWGLADGVAEHPSPGLRAHADAAERSLRMAWTIAEMVKTDPTLVRRARRHVEALLREGQGTADADLGEWRQLLETYSDERLRDLLVSTSSRADRLRRSSPFFAVLTPGERDRLLRELEDAR